MSASLQERIRALDLDRMRRSLSSQGWALVQGLVTPEECNAVVDLYSREELFRSKVIMARHGFGQGEYRYFDYPLPDFVFALRTELFPPLSVIANEWNDLLGKEERFALAHAAYLRLCTENGQSRPTPLMLRYGEGDYNCLHQDLYGDQWFPLQAAVLLSEPGRQFEGGEFVLTEQRPRMQSRPYVVPARRGDAIVFAVNEVPRIGQRGPYRVKMRHGVARIHRGERFALGVIFHDAR